MVDLFEIIYIFSVEWLKANNLPLRRRGLLITKHSVGHLQTVCLGEKKKDCEAQSNQKAYFFSHLIITKYFTDTHDCLVIGFLCVVNERRQVEVDSK